MAIIGIIQLNIIIIISNLFFTAFFLFYCESFIKTQELKENRYYGHLETMPPLGSIIPWIGANNAGMDVPTRWQKCDGSLIEQGPLAGQTTPNLNGKELFIRGGSDKDSGRIEDDALEEHSHKDPGHTHKDRGHTHTQEEHSHQIDESDSDNEGFIVSSFASRDTELMCHANSGGTVWCVNWNKKTAKSTATINTSRASIGNSKTGVGEVSGGKSASETRPKNMRLVYIIRVL